MVPLTSSVGSQLRDEGDHLRAMTNCQRRKTLAKSTKAILTRKKKNTKVGRRVIGKEGKRA